MVSLVLASCLEPRGPHLRLVRRLFGLSTCIFTQTWGYLAVAGRKCPVLLSRAGQPDPLPSSGGNAVTAPPNTANRVRESCSISGEKRPSANHSETSFANRPIFSTSSAVTCASPPSASPRSRKSMNLRSASSRRISSPGSVSIYAACASRPGRERLPAMPLRWGRLLHARGASLSTGGGNRRPSRLPHDGAEVM